MSGLSRSTTAPGVGMTSFGTAPTAFRMPAPSTAGGGGFAIGAIGTGGTGATGGFTTGGTGTTGGFATGTTAGGFATATTAAAPTAAATRPPATAAGFSLPAASTATTATSSFSLPTATTARSGFGLPSLATAGGAASAPRFNLAAVAPAGAAAATARPGTGTAATGGGSQPAGGTGVGSLPASMKPKDEKVTADMEKAALALDDYIKNTKKASHAMDSRSDQGLKNMDQVLMVLRQKLHRAEADMARVKSLLKRLKQRTLEGVKQAELCERLRDSGRAPQDLYGMYGQSGSSPVADFYISIVTKFEQEAEVYRNQLHELEGALATSDSSADTAEALQELFKLLSESFLGLSSHLQQLHQKTNDEAAKFMRLYKQTKRPQDPDDPFAAAKRKAKHQDEEFLREEEYQRPKFGMPGGNNPYADPQTLQQQQRYLLAQQQQQFPQPSLGFGGFGTGTGGGLGLGAGTGLGGGFGGFGATSTAGTTAGGFGLGPISRTSGTTTTGSSLGFGTRPAGTTTTTGVGGGFGTGMGGMGGIGGGTSAAPGFGRGTGAPAGGFGTTPGFGATAGGFGATAGRGTGFGTAGTTGGFGAGTTAFGGR